MIVGDILIKGGTVVQPTKQFMNRADILIKDGLVAKILTNGEDVKVNKVINADGCLVTPGLIDSHTHLFNGGTEIGVNPDAFLLPQGVTAAVDQGSAGIGNYESFFKDIIAASEMKIFSYINVASSGLTTLPRCLENLNPEKFDIVKLRQMLKKYSKHLLGLKIRTSRDIVGNYGYEPLKKTRELADELQCRMVVHTTDAPGTLDELISYFKAGDIYAHPFQGRHNAIIDSDGHVNPLIRAARAKGVIFDSSDGRDHYRFSVLRQALEEGFYPDTLSTDLVRANVFDKAVFGLPLIMSKYYNLGMSLLEVIKACTSTPAQILGCDTEFGTLLPGSCADIAILKLQDAELIMKDVFGDSMLCKQLFINKLTILNGKIVFAQLDFSKNIDEYR